MASRAGIGERVASATSRSAVTVAAPGRPTLRAPARIASRAARSSSRPATSTSRSASSSSSGDQQRAPRGHQLLCVGPLMARGMGIGHHDDRQPQRGRLGHGRRPGATHEQVGGQQRRGHLVAQEGRRAVPLPERLGKVHPDLARLLDAGLPRDVDDAAPLHEPWQGQGHRRVEPPHGLRAAEHEQHRQRIGDGQPFPGGRPVHALDGADGRPGQVGPTGQVILRTGVRDRERGCEPRGGAHAPASEPVALPHERRHAQQDGRRERRDGHIATGRVQHVGSPAEHVRGGLRGGDGEPQRIGHGRHGQVHGAQGPQREPVKVIAGGRHDLGLDPPMAPQPSDLEVRPLAPELPKGGQGGEDVAAGATSRDEDAHHHRYQCAGSRARPRAGPPRRRS